MRRFRAILAQDGVETAEGFIIRDFPAGAFTWEPSELPLALQAVVESYGGHAGAFPLGQITQMERHGTWIVGLGLLDDEGAGDDADRRRDVIGMIERGTLNRLSVDPGNGGIEVEEECEREDEDGWCEQVRVTFTRYSIGGATLVAMPALQGTLIELLPDEDEEAEATAAEALDAIAASAVADEATWAPPVEWFGDPGLTELTQHPQVSEDGRVAVHVAAHDACHVGFPDYCQTPWLSQSGYAYAHAAAPDHPGVPDEWRNADGGWAGVLSLTGGHFPTSGPDAGNIAAVQAHYDDPSSVIAYVRFGHDEHGIYAAGALRPGVTPEEVARFRAHRLSGDWRRINGRMELIAACSVNVPGFVRAIAASADGEAMAAVVACAPLRMQPDAAEEHACSCGGGASTAGAPVITNVVGGLSDEDRAMLRQVHAALAPTIREQLRGRLAGRGA